jgi:hypothetical protein
MTKSQMVQVAEQLLQQTMAGKVVWEAAEERENAYKVSFPDTTLVVSRRSPLRDCRWSTVRDLSHSFGVDVASYRLELLDGDRQVLETLLAVPGQAAHRTLRQLYARAHSQVSHAEEKISRVMEYLRETGAESAGG